MATCTLCGLDTAHPLTNEAGDVFCCPACLEVSSLLAEPGGAAAKNGAPASSRPAAGRDAGALLENTTISLSGLWCPSCAWLINERLDRSPGIQTAEVNFIRREALVTYNPAQTGPRRIARQIKKFGYGARLEEDNPYNEEEAEWMRLLISGVLVMHIMFISFMLYFREWTGRAAPETEWLADIFRLMIASFSVPVILIIGLPILRAGIASLIRGRPNTHTLIAIGSFAAFALSARNLALGQGDVYFDTAAVLLFLVAIGHWLELRAQKVSGEAVERLWRQIPPEATWLTPQGWRRGPADEIPLGTRVRVRPGERFPVDGLVASGEGDVDESVVTGEPDPAARREGDTALAGTTNLDGSFEVIATAVGAQTVVGQIGQLLHQAMWQRAPVERQADRLAAWLVPLAVTLALAAFAFWTWQDSMETGLIHALAVLLIACPCALGIATPLTLWVGLGRATRSGVILRYTGVLEQLAEAGQIYFDKTGTLTKRPIRLQEAAVVGDRYSVIGDRYSVIGDRYSVNSERSIVNRQSSIENLLRRAAAVEGMSEHPLGQAIASGAEKWLDNLPPRAEHFRAFPGLGAGGVVAGDEVWIGSRRLMARQGLEMPKGLTDTAVSWQEEGLTVVYAGWRGRVQGLLGLGETARAETAETIADLQKLNLPVAILTGDSAAAGQRWQAALGVPVYAEQRPEDKVNRLKAAGENVVMVGDGINDGPALAAASAGIAVRQGTDVAQSAAAVILLHDDLRAVPWLMALSRIAMRKVRQNLAWAIGYNAIGLVLAVSGLLQPSLAALLMVFSNIIVTTNALRLRQADLGDLSFVEAEEKEMEEIGDRGLEIGAFTPPISNLQSPISNPQNG